VEDVPAWELYDHLTFLEILEANRAFSTAFADFHALEFLVIFLG
jgi:hypothetical protein